MFPRRFIIVAAIIVLTQTSVQAGDWPMWRYDANRSAASPHPLLEVLHLQWTRQYPALRPAWPDQPKMQFDAAYEPIVLGKTLFVGSPCHDCVTALDTRTGEQKWRFFTDGPIRFAPVAWERSVYFTSDDGHLYCVDAEKGTLVWKFRGAPADRRILGNERLISTWPARGAPVIADDTVYFAAGIWPFMGIFIHALDAKTGEVRWTNDGDGSIYMKQPHNADSFAGVAPQGPMTVLGNKLLIPGGRSVPALYDRRDGKMRRYQLAENGKRGGGHDVAAIGKIFFNGGAAFDVETERHLADFSKFVVLTEDVIFAHHSGALRSYDLKTAAVKETKTVDRKGLPQTTVRWSISELMKPFKLPSVQALILAGARLYAASGKEIVAVDVTARRSQPALAWQTKVDGEVARLIAADDRLFAVTYEGHIHCFGHKRVQAKQHNSPSLEKGAGGGNDKYKAQAKSILDSTGVREGYCLVWGAGDGQLVRELAEQSRLRIIAFDPDAEKVQRLREELVETGLYGSRVAAHVGRTNTFSLPPYFASLAVIQDELPDNAIAEVFETLRPYGGVMCLGVRTRGLTPVGSPKRVGDYELIVREGPLPGSANWTHEHADASNTRVSKDKLVKLPLGVLWFGGPSNEAVLPRHGHGPQPQVIDGRLIIEGADMLRCMDIYTGRILWETSLPGVGAFYDNTAHQPGANSAGTNYISMSDGIYVAYGRKCVWLDPATGKTSEFALPVLAGMKGPPRWGYINVVDNYLIGGAEPVYDRKFDRMLPKGVGDDPDPNEKKKADAGLLGKLLLDFRTLNDNFSGSKHLVVMDRHTGKVLWTTSAQNWFRHNGTCVGGGRLYTIDRLSGPQLSAYKRRGEEPPHAPRLLAFDLATGKPLWSTATDVFGTWLSYSEKHDVLLEAGRVARDTLTDEPRGVRAYKAGTGNIIWYEKNHVGPAMIHGDTLLLGQSACDLLTGALKMRDDPLTGAKVPWQWIRNYGCNTPAASEHLLTFRSGAAGFYDLCNDGGTGNFGGFRSSCTNNLIVAGGILTAPDYTRTCICNYQNQTSLALVHMPEAEVWTSFGVREVKGPIKRLGLALGAPGDRRAEDGTLWLEYPGVGGVSPAVAVTLTPKDPQWFRRHSSQIQGKYNWVAASGAKGLSSVRIKLGESTVARNFTVRLYFVEPDNLPPGKRRFHVSLQGREVLKDLDIVQEAGSVNRSLIREFRDVQVMGDLVIGFTASAGLPVLCGVEVVQSP